MVKSMLTGMAEYYSAELSEKVVRGMTENVLKGKYNGGTIPIGFKVDEEKFFQVDPLKAPFVVEAFQRYNDGATMKELMNWLNDSGVTTNRNQKFTYNSVQTLLTNKRYIGENHFNFFKALKYLRFSSGSSTKGAMVISPSMRMLGKWEICSTSSMASARLVPNLVSSIATLTSTRIGITT